MIDIAHKMEIGLPAVSQIVDRLVRRGLFERQPDPQDRRVVRVVLTEPARLLINEAHKYRQSRMDATLELLGDREVDAVIRGLELLATAAEQIELKERDGREQSGTGELDEPVRMNGDPLVELIQERTRSRRMRPQSAVLPTVEQRRP